jgi:O-antigen ligase
VAPDDVIVATLDDVEQSSAAAEPGGGLRSRRFEAMLRLPRTPVGLAAGGFAFLLPLLTLRVAFAPGWTPRYALLGIEAAIGVPFAFALLRSPARRPAAAALAFGAVASLSTLLSDNASMSFFGMNFWGTGLLFIAALIGMWAIGTSSDKDGAAAVERALLVGVVVNVTVVVLEVLFDVSRLGVLMFRGQPAGLLGQPVALGAFLVGGLWLAGGRVVRESGLRWPWLVVAVAAAIELTGERIPLLLLPPVLLALSWKRPWPRVGIIVASVLVGLLLGSAIGSIDAATPEASTRLAGPAGQTPRTQNYVTALNAIWDRPVLGWGPGRYQAATSQYRSRALEAAEPDGLFADAHDSILQYGVTTGVAGLGLMAAWVLLALRRASGPLLGFASLIMLVQLAQPQDVGLTPLAFLALGAAGATSAPRRRTPVLLHAVLVALGVVFAALVLVGGYPEWRASQGSRSDALAVSDMLPHWPERALLASKATIEGDGGTATERVAGARAWLSEAIARDRRDVRSYVQAAYLDLLVGDTTTASDHLNDAIRLSPWSPNALADLGALEVARGNTDAAIDYFRRAVEIDPNEEFAKRMLATLSP